MVKSVSAKLCAAEIFKRELHEFHFRTHLFGDGVALNAFELRNGSPAGYQFQIIGEPQGDFWRSSSIASTTLPLASRSTFPRTICSGATGVRWRSSWTLHFTGSRKSINSDPS